MKRIINRYKSIRRNEKGSVIIEAAFVFPVFIYLTFAFLEIAIVLFYMFVIESAMYDATRVAKVAVDPASMAQAVRDAVQERSFGMLPVNEVVITTDLAVNLADDWRNSGEECTDASGVILPGEFCPNCAVSYMDANNNNICDGPPPLDLGAPGNIVSVVAFYRKPRYTPFIGDVFPEKIDIRSGVIFRNEPG